MHPIFADNEVLAVGINQEADKIRTHIMAALA
jgi:hypothetical protein